VKLIDGTTRGQHVGGRIHPGGGRVLTWAYTGSMPGMRRTPPLSALVAKAA